MVSEEKREKWKQARTERSIESSSLSRKRKIKIAAYGIIGLIIFSLLFFTYADSFKGNDYINPGIQREVLGNKDSKIIVKEFSDLQCPACASASLTFEKIISEYDDIVRFEFYHYPLRGLHPQAFLAAQGAECANDFGKFWQFVDLAYKNQDNLKKDGLTEIAAGLGINAGEFEKCLDSGAKKSIIERDIISGNKLGIQGTPTFYINDKELESWNYIDFREALDNELAK